MKPIVMKILILVMLAGVLAGCNAAAATPTTDPKVVYTQVAQTVAAQITNAAKLTPKATFTPMPTETLAPSPTAKPTNATIVALTGTAKPGTAAPTSATKLPATATATGIALATAIPTAGGLPAIPDVMSYMSQNIPDNTAFSPSQTFTLIFVIKNIGTSTWDEKYRIRFFGGERSGAPDDALTSTVKPGSTYHVTLKMTAPSKKGSYSSLWVISNPDLRNFGSFYLNYEVK